MLANNFVKFWTTGPWGIRIKWKEHLCHNKGDWIHKYRLNILLNWMCQLLHSCSLTSFCLSHAKFLDSVKLQFIWLMVQIGMKKKMQSLINCLINKQSIVATFSKKGKFTTSLGKILFLLSKNSLHFFFFFWKLGHCCSDFFWTFAILKDSSQKRLHKSASWSLSSLCMWCKTPCHLTEL